MSRLPTCLRSWHTWRRAWHEAFGRMVVWSHPAFAEKCVFVRNDKEVVCYSLAK